MLLSSAPVAHTTHDCIVTRLGSDLNILDFILTLFQIGMPRIEYFSLLRFFKVCKIARSKTDLKRNIA